MQALRLQKSGCRSTSGGRLVCLKPLIWCPAPHKQGVMAHACNTSTQGSNSQGHPQLHIVFQASLGYMTVCLKKERKKKKEKKQT